MNWVRKAIQYKNQIVFTAGLLLPAFVIFVYPAWYQPDDLDAFLIWSREWAKGAQDIYINCIYCNYPFLGMAFSAGAVNWLGIRDFDGMIGLFRYYLAFIDLTNVVLLYFLLQTLKVKDAAFWAGVVGILPSSWMGTSYWGQIDNVGQSFILGILLITAGINTIQNSNRSRSYLLAFILGILLACLLMTKQLVFFSMISLGSMAVANIVIVSRKLTDALLSFTAFAFAIFAPIWLVDSLVNHPQPYLSHLHYILATGSSHGDILSSFGFNIWTYVTDNPLGSSREPLSVFGMALIPYQAGMTIFLASVVLLTVASIYFYIGEFKKENRNFDSTHLSFWLIHLALVNLSFNLFLTGAHERYLYHFYPFAIAALLILQKFDGAHRIILLGGAFLYGIFLFGYLTGFNLYFGQLPYLILTILHLYLLIFFSRLWMKFFPARTRSAIG